MVFNLMQQDQDSWGPDADVYRPERWEDLKPMWKYIPFLGGPRKCPAQQMMLAHHGYPLVIFMKEVECMGNRDEDINSVEEYRTTKKAAMWSRLGFGHLKHEIEQDICVNGCL